jgi:hypothetical protein
MPDAATPSTGEPEEVSQEESTPTDDAAPDVPVFANRAERRARGRGKPAVQSERQGKGPHPGGRGSVQTPRQWGNRRTG